MAATVEGRRLTEAHRLAQLRIGTQTIAAMIAVWPLLDINDLDRSFTRWLRAALPLIGAQRARSARLAANYLSTFRALELGVEIPPFTPILAETLPAAAVATSMLVTGPAAIRAARAHGISTAQALSTAQARSSAAALRHALNGGRDTITGAVSADGKAIGWARVTGGSACSFCAMLAGRGPVYSTDTVNFHAHDSCKCGVEAVYRRDTDWPAGTRRYGELWDTATAGLSGDDAARAFRAALAAA